MCGGVGNDILLEGPLLASSSTLGMNAAKYVSSREGTGSIVRYATAGKTGCAPLHSKVYCNAMSVCVPPTSSPFKHDSARMRSSASRALPRVAVDERDEHSWSLSSATCR